MMSVNKRRRVPGGSLESNDAIIAALDNAIKMSASAEVHVMNQYGRI